MAMVRLLKYFLAPGVRISGMEVTGPGTSVNTYERDQKWNHFQGAPFL